MSISDCRKWMETIDNPLAEDIKRAATERMLTPSRGRIYSRKLQRCNFYLCNL
jgi:hypothetical protein